MCGGWVHHTTAAAPAPGLQQYAVSTRILSLTHPAPVAASNASTLWRLSVLWDGAVARGPSSRWVILVSCCRSAAALLHWVEAGQQHCPCHPGCMAHSATMHVTAGYSGPAPSRRAATAQICGFRHRRRMAHGFPQWLRQGTLPVSALGFAGSHGCSTVQHCVWHCLLEYALCLQRPAPESSAQALQPAACMHPQGRCRSLLPDTP